MRLKEICILNSFEQKQENTIAGSAFSARLGSSAVAFIPDPVQQIAADLYYGFFLKMPELVNTSVTIVMYFFYALE